MRRALGPGPSPLLLLAVLAALSSCPEPQTEPDPDPEPEPPTESPLPLQFYADNNVVDFNTPPPFIIDHSSVFDSCAVIVIDDADGADDDE